MALASAVEEECRLFSSGHVANAGARYEGT